MSRSQEYEVQSEGDLDLDAIAGGSSMHQDEEPQGFAEPPRSELTLEQIERGLENVAGMMNERFERLRAELQQREQNI